MKALILPLLLALTLIAGGFSACSVPDRDWSSGGADGGAGEGNDSTNGGDAQGGSSGACSSGQARCDGLVPQRCSETREWVPTQASCAAACLNGECVACVEDATACKDGAIQKCAGGSWATIQVCEKVCQVDKCVDSCGEGLYQCNGSRTLQKCVAGEFVDDTSCEFLCSNGACIGACTPDTRRCNPEAANESQICGAQGAWGESAPCAADTFCVGGRCKPCKPETARCSEAGPQLCSEAGEWVNQGACAAPNGACFEGECVACTPGEKRCRDQSVEQCAADGSSWTVFETCSGDTPACLVSMKACGKCVKGTTQCLDDDVQTCDDAGAFQTSESCSASTPQCVGGRCAACDPAAGERRCPTAASTQSCSADGTWATAIDCSGDTPRCREDLGFSCGCEDGERRCKNSSVPELCQGGAWVVQSACSGTLDYCLPATGECVDCIPNTAECRNGVAHQCNSAGVFESLNSCSGPGINCGNCNLGEVCTDDSECKTGFCVAGKCASCDPESRSCVGTTPRVCSSTGSWTNQTNCSGNTPECLPSTGQCVACLNTASRACGNCNTGSQTCSNNTWGACTGAIDLSTSEQYCGSCTKSCSPGQVCESSTCLVDCGARTRCGTACVNVATDTSNCLECGTRCNPPASNGVAVCTSSGCDISCNNTRCGTSCCDATPARATAGCSGNSCTFTCSSGNHGCGASTPPCYANTDGSHCGSSCLNCSTYPGTTGACSNNQCACEGSTLACGASVPTCGSWDFNSNTVEGWRLGDYSGAAEHAWVGGIGTATTNGSPALTAKFDGVTQAGKVAEFEVDLCPNGSILNLSSYVLSYDFYFLTTGGSRFSQGSAARSLLANNRSVITGCQPFVEPGSDEWIHAECANLPSSLTNLTIVFELATQWAGSIFIDNVKFTPK